MGITKINSGQVRFQDPIAVVFIPWADGVIGSDGYDIHDIVGDTFALTQDDANRTEIPWEFGDDPLDENISLGNRNVTMQCLDYQNAIMKNLFGWDTDTEGFAAAPTQYNELVCTIILQFDGKSVVMPKVKMDSKTALENLRTDIARGELRGVLYSTPVTMGEAEKETGLFFMVDGKSFTIGSTTVAISAEGEISINGSTPSTVATPVIAGTTPFTTSTEVTITCATDGASIYYTTDGSTPTSASTAYTQAFTLTATTTVKAIAIKNGVSSEVATKTFTKQD